MKKRVEIAKKISIESSILLISSQIGILMDQPMQKDLKGPQGINLRINTVLGFSLIYISKKKEIISIRFMKL